MFERGFKSWCERVALQQRQELQLQPSDPLDPMRLAAHLGIRIWSPTDIPGLDENCLRILLKEDPDSWSAFTLIANSARLIIINSAHSPGRQRSDIMHEVAHILLGHEAAKVFVSPDGVLLLNTFKQSQEEEATWLAGCLLLPREALVMIRRQRLSDDETKARFGVTNDMLAFRVRMSGVDKQFSRTRSSSLRRSPKKKLD